MCWCRIITYIYHFSGVSDHSEGIVSRLSIPDLDQPVSTPADNFLVIKIAAVNSCELERKLLPVIMAIVVT